MTSKTYQPVNAAAIKGFLKAKGFTMKRIEEMTDGRITENSLKHFLNKGKKADEETLDILASLLDCSKNKLIDNDYLLSMNLSYEINTIAASLFLRNKEDVNRHYSHAIKKFRTSIDLAKILEQADSLYLTLSEEEFAFDNNPFLKGFELICKEYTSEKCISNYRITEIKDDVAQALFRKINSCPTEYDPQHALLMFVYVFILFDAIFTAEAIASVTQLVPERKTEKADQYFELAYKCEKMRNVLIDRFVYKDIMLNETSAIENGIDDLIMEGIMLMLAACEKCYLHIHSDFVDSEYLNRASYSAVLTKLEKIFFELGIELPESDSFSEFMSMNTTRFGRQYYILQNCFRMLNPPRQPKRKDLSFLDAYILSESGFFK